MEKELETAYKEEYIRQKARYDFEKNQQAASPPKINYGFYNSLIYMIIGGFTLYILYDIYHTFY
ncbi:MAG: hypothetical protein ACOWWO_08375 [Peptococcaceae bacterium]